MVALSPGNVIVGEDIFKVNQDLTPTTSISCRPSLTFSIAFTRYPSSMCQRTKQSSNTSSSSSGMPYLVTQPRDNMQQMGAPLPHPNAGASRHSQPRAVPTAKDRPVPQVRVVRRVPERIPRCGFCPRKCANCGFSFVPGADGDNNDGNQFCSGECFRSSIYYRIAPRKRRAAIGNWL